MKNEIPYYQDYITEAFQAYLALEGKKVEGVAGLVEIGTGGGLESRESFTFVCALYSKLKPELNRVLNQRIVDRKFIDERTKSYFEFNNEYEILLPESTKVEIHEIKTE